MNARENVIRTLNHDRPEWVPVNLWQLPAVKIKYGNKLETLIEEFDPDIIFAPFNDPTEDPRHYKVGSYTDCWGSTWSNYQEGIIGEVKSFPLVEFKNIWDYKSPKELLLSGKENLKETNKFISNHHDKFILGGWISIFERMQFLRGTENLFMDTLMEEPEYFKLLEVVEDYYMTYLDLWLSTDVDGIVFGDDWGSQRSLLISPETWKTQFKPVYKRFFDKIHAAGKYVFMHSDGYIYDLYDELIEIGVDAINSQVWCMGVEKVAVKCNHRITNWGEVCRQHILPRGTVDDVVDAVKKMKENLWVNGGLIGQFEAGPDMPFENIKAGLINWNK
ncbi:MAG: uroporphyrinogen decarboxylase family protein [Muribaculaceae bacterium]|nr:uroporphyrinogen decarboxylase family protein [Muribaculaceae bacterium]